MRYVKLMSPDPSSDIRIFSKPLSHEGSSVLMGFPGSGLVGSIALQYMVDQLEFTQIGSMNSKYFPPLAMMNRGVINIPVRVFEKENLAAIVADIPIHPSICYEVANGIMEWLMPFNIREVVTIAGIITNETEKRVFGVATSEEALPRIQESTIILPIGSISGIASSFLIECRIRNIDAFGLLGETINAPDPRASAAIIGVLNKMYGLELDIQPLLEQADEIESTMHKLAEQVQTAEALPKKEQQLPMYG
jgi:uncharacterized protein